MADPVIAQKSPMAVDVEQGKNYFWCACGKSASQPFCDGSHEATDFMPVKWTAPETAQVFFCCCKRTSDQPLCDGAHNKL